jgi:hypothetical protein
MGTEKHHEQSQHNGCRGRRVELCTFSIWTKTSNRLYQVKALAQSRDDVASSWVIYWCFALSSIRCVSCCHSSYLKMLHGCHVFTCLKIILKLNTYFLILYQLKKTSRFGILWHQHCSDGHISCGGIETSTKYSAKIIRWPYHTPRNAENSVHRPVYESPRLNQAEEQAGSISRRVCFFLPPNHSTKFQHAMQARSPLK